MERIAILDHDRHRLYVEDIPDEIIDAPEWDGEEEYIKGNYAVNNFSWEFITEAVYFPAQAPYDDPIEINFEDIKDI